MYFCTDVDSRLVLFERHKEGNQIRFAAAAYKDGKSWRVLGTPDKGDNLLKTLAEHEARWRDNLFFSGPQVPSTAAVLKSRLEPKEMFSAIAVWEFHEALLKLLKSASAHLAKPVATRMSGAVLAPLYQELLAHMALDALLEILEEDTPHLDQAVFVEDHGAAIWDVAYHAYVRSGDDKRAMEAMERALNYQNNLERRQLLLPLLADHERDHDVLFTCAQIARTRPLAPFEVAHKGMAYVRLEEWENVVECIEALWALGGAASERYAIRLSEKLPDGQLV